MENVKTVEITIGNLMMVEPVTMINAPLIKSY